MRLDYPLLQPLHRALELLDARLELVGLSRSRGQTRTRDLDDGTGHDPRERDYRYDDKSEIRLWLYSTRGKDRGLPGRRVVCGVTRRWHRTSYQSVSVTCHIGLTS